MPPADNPLPLVVLNPKGRDPDQDFAEGPGAPGACGHPPVNYHAYAACSRGSFLRSTNRVPEGATVLLLLRRDLRPAQKALPELAAKKARVLVAWKEAGLHQVSRALDGSGQWNIFSAICRATHGALTPTPDLSPVFQAAGAPLVHYLPTPYPVDFPQWNFQQTGADRSGIFLGTREFFVPSRNHTLALELALAATRTTGTTLTMIDDGSVPGWQRKRLRAGGVNLIRGPLAYDKYLGLLASHRVVFQLDQSAVPGQVAGDCLLARVLCVGGNGAIEREAFPHTCGHGRTLPELASLLHRAIIDSRWLAEAESTAFRLALEKLSFAATSAKIKQACSAL